MKFLSRRPLRLCGVLTFCTLVIAGCDARADLTIHDDDTFSMKARFSQVAAPGSSLDCDRLQTALDAAGGKEQAKVIDRSTASQVRCELDITKPQPISAAKAPFVQIKRSHNLYQVRLDGTPSLAGLSAVDFRLTVNFPGPVVDAARARATQVVGNSVTWRDASVLAKGFEVSGRAVSGLSNQQILLFILVAATLGVLYSYLPSIAAKSNLLVEKTVDLQIQARALMERTIVRPRPEDAEESTREDADEHPECLEDSEDPEDAAAAKDDLDGGLGSKVASEDAAVSVDLADTADLGVGDDNGNADATATVAAAADTVRPEDSGTQRESEHS
ncbi:MAG: hypothetical protein Q4A71_04725 [Actinomycetaceae bacterium]|nr:hypothetical protein [Actinomycetaceae bacterium]